jgi:serine/threonine protein kinase
MALAVGDRIGPYEILASLGSGGMGEVYQARDIRLGRAVAIKVLSSARGTAPAEIARFQREAKAIARLSHPYICTLHDVGEQDSVPFLVMELVEGVALAERLERGPVPLGEALVTGAQIATALDAAHRNGVVHRDLKPGNVMLTPSGVKLLDFGLAKLRDGGYSDDVGAPTKSVRLTDDGTVLGTLPYMAPEQVEGLEADARTDIFALGIVLYEMITGEAPFRGASRASLTAAILTHNPPAIGSRIGAVPATVDRVVQKCLAKNPEDRWQSARDLASALELSPADSAVEHETTRATTPPRRHVTAIAAAALAAAVGLGALAVWALGRSTGTPPQPRTTAAYRQVTFRRGAVSSARFTPDGQSFVYSASWENRPWGMYLGRAQSPDVRDLGVDGARLVSISQTGDMAMVVGPQNIIRAFGTRTLARVPMAGGAHRDLETGIVDADWIPDTDTLAVVRDPGGGRPWTVEFPLGTIVHEARAAWSLRVSPDGARVAFFEGPALFEGAPSATIMVIDRSGRKLTIAQRLGGIGLAWTPRGAEVWFTATRPGWHGPHILAASLAGVERAVHRAPDWLMLHDIAADGKVLLSRNSIRISLSCQSKGEREEHDRGWMLSSIVRGLSDDGLTAVFEDNLIGQTSAGNRTVFLRRLDGSAAVPLGEGFEPKLSPDGKWALVRIGDTYSLLPTGIGSNATLGKGDLGQLLGAAWFPNSKRIAFAAIPSGEKRARGYIQDIPDGIPRAITPPAVYLSGKQATVPDEHSVLGLAEAEGRWMIYPLNGGAPQAVPGLTGQDVPIQWSPDGRSLYVFVPQPPPTPHSFDVFRVDVASGRRTLWKTLQPVDPVGVENFPGTLVMTRDATSYCYSYLRRLGDLFVVEGLQ